MEPGESNTAARERLEFPLRFVDPESAEPGGADDHHDLRRVRQHGEDVLDLSRQVENPRDGRRAGAGRRSVQLALLEAGSEKGRRREEILAMTETKPARRASDRDHEVQGMVVEEC